MRRIASIIFVYISLAAAFVSCGPGKGGSLWYAPLGLGEDKIVLVGGNAAGSTSYAVSIYKTDGTLERVIDDFGYNNGEQPRGVVAVDAFTFIVAIEGTTDRLAKVYRFGGSDSLPLNAQFTGNIFDVERDGSGNIYVVESNSIERFDSSGDRFGGTSATPYITTPVGACVLNTPHGLTINDSGYLVTVNSATNTLLLYNVSSSTASCVSSVAVSNAPRDIVSVGGSYMYFVTQTNDGIYRTAQNGTGATLLYSGAATYNPSAVAALPNGNLIVANEGNDGIDIFDTSGNLLSTNFIKNSFTENVSDIMILKGK